jgi:hypothetical protein
LCVSLESERAILLDGNVVTLRDPTITTLSLTCWCVMCCVARVEQKFSFGRGSGNGQETEAQPSPPGGKIRAWQDERDPFDPGSTPTGR